MPPYLAKYLNPQVNDSQLSALRLLGDTSPYQQDPNSGMYVKDQAALQRPPTQVSDSQLSALRLLGDTSPYQQDPASGMYTKDQAALSPTPPAPQPPQQPDPRIEALRAMLNNSRPAIQVRHPMAGSVSLGNRD